MTRFPQIRRLISTSAVATPCLLFLSYMLFARGHWLWSGLGFSLAGILFLAFPHFIAVRPNLRPEFDRGGWIPWLAKYGVFWWGISQPEFTAFQNRVVGGGALWDWRLIISLAVLTAYGIYHGLRRVPQITDLAIYSYLAAPVAGVAERPASAANVSSSKSEDNHVESHGI